MRTPPRTIRRSLESGRAVFGAVVQLPSPDIVEIAGYAGLDFVWIDAEHGTFGLSDVNALVRAADASGIDAIVRVPDHSPSYIQRVLDIGAAGIIVPHVRNPAEGAAIVSAATFAPSGARGACPSTRVVGHRAPDWPSARRVLDADVLTFGMIEDIDGVDNVEAIAHESGLDGLLFGPFDLSQALGFEGDITRDEIKAMHRRVISAVQAAGIEFLSIPTWEYGDLRWVATYSRIMAISGDRGLLMAAFRDSLAASRQQLAVADKVSV